METQCIKDLEKVLEPYLDNNVRIISYETRPLIPAGENYGSILAAVDIKCANTKTEKQHILNLVCKMVPKNEWIQNMFNTPIAFKKEAAIYSTIQETVCQFESENGVKHMWNMLPKYYGSRLSLSDPNAKFADADAILVLENLKTQGLYTPNRMVGFNFKEAEAIIKTLAVFHSVPLAMKLKQPQSFEKHVKPHLAQARLFCDVSEDIELSSRENVIKFASLNEDCVPYLDALRKSVNEGGERYKYGATIREPFATLCHNDFWVNNVMLLEEDSEIKRVCMVDFQIMDYGSPAKDLIFFLFSSVQIAVLTEKLDYFVRLYHTTFIDVLKAFNCNLSEFGFKAFEKEMEIEAYSTQLFHCLIMLSPIYTKKDDAIEVNNLQQDMLLRTDYADGYKERLWFIVKEFIKRGWLK